MGAVYKARQPKLDRMVALKLLPPPDAGGAKFADRFNREARALAKLSHPNIVAVHEFGQIDGQHFFIMEFVDGANLRQLERAGRLSPREALQIIPQICDALQYAHDEGVVHRDIKPENVLVDRKGRVKIADFGLAKILGQDTEALRLTREGQVMGTPHYMAPEQVERPLTVDHRADIYALGVVLYEMLTGDLPLGNFSPPSRKVQVDVRFDEVVLRALENNPDRRYQQASEVKSRVEIIATTPAAAEVPATEQPEKGRRCFHWAGFRLAEEFRGRRTLNRKELLKAWAILFGLLTLALAPVSMIFGYSYLGFIGLSGWSSLAFRAGAAAVIIGIVVCWVLIRPDAAAVDSPDRTWWRQFWKRSFFVIFCIAAWTVLQFNWLQPWLKEQFREASRKQVAVRDTQSGAFTARLPNGTTIELLALASGDAEPNQWWRPDGTPIENVTFEIQGPGEMQGADRLRSKFAFKVTDWPSIMETASYDFVPAAGVSAGGSVWQNGEKLAGAWPIRVSWAYATNRATLRFGFRYDPWRTIAAQSMKDPSRSFNQVAAGDPKWISTFNHISDNGTNTLVTAVLNPETKQWRMRIVAVDTDGKEHSHNRANTTPAENTETWTCTFANLTLNRVKEFQVQVQPVHWVEFRDVALQPKGAAASPTGLAFGPAQEITFSELIDFDTGKTAHYPPAKPGSGPLDGIGDSIAWMQQNGFDAAAGVGELQPLGVTIVELSSSDWDTLTPAALIQRLETNGTFPSELKPGGDVPSPATFGFRTREGGTGLLQLVSFADPSIGATVRYKVVRRAYTGPDLSVSMADSDLSVARARLRELAAKYTDEHPEIVVVRARIKVLESINLNEVDGPSDLREAKAQLTELRTRYTDSHPLVQQAQARIRALEAR